MLNDDAYRIDLRENKKGDFLRLKSQAELKSPINKEITQQNMATLSLKQTP